MSLGAEIVSASFKKQKKEKGEYIMNTLEIRLVSDTDGDVDVQATLDAARTQIVNLKAQRETEDNAILTHLNAVFDELKASGTRGNMPYIVNAVLTRMGIAQMPSSYKVLNERVHKFIQANAQGKTDKVTKAVERPDSLFVVSKGKLGGLGRRSDLTPAAADEIASS
jgi:hypothetical protein